MNCVPHLQELCTSNGIFNHRVRRERRGIGVWDNFCVSPHLVEKWCKYQILSLSYFIELYSKLPP